MSNKVLVNHLKGLSDEELKGVSLERNKKGNYTARANLAQKIRNQRSGAAMFNGENLTYSEKHLALRSYDGCCFDDYDENSYP